jgi:hypothetical protein
MDDSSFVVFEALKSNVRENQDTPLHDIEEPVRILHQAMFAGWAIQGVNPKYDDDTAVRTKCLPYPSGLRLSPDRHGLFDLLAGDPIAATEEKEASDPTEDRHESHEERKSNPAHQSN